MTPNRNAANALLTLLLKQVDGDARSVYFVQAADGGPVKIGAARQIEQRLKTLRAHSPVALTLIGVMPNAGSAVEAALHRLFADDRLHGEWFRPSVDLLHFITQHAEAAA